MKYFVTAQVKIEVESDLSYEDMIDELGTETNYEFGSTENVNVIQTAILEIQ